MSYRGKGVDQEEVGHACRVSSGGGELPPQKREEKNEERGSLSTIDPTLL